MSPDLDLERIALERPQGRVKNVYRGPGVAFVPHPHINGAWIKVHPCVVERHCPTCGVTPGALCLFRKGTHTTSHHFTRNRGRTDAPREQRPAQPSNFDVAGTAVLSAPAPVVRPTQRVRVKPGVFCLAKEGASTCLLEPGHAGQHQDATGWWPPPGVELPPPTVLDREDAP